jgi:hypothetical protein
MTITFEQIRERVEAHYQRQAAPMTALTPCGEAIRTIYHLRRQLAALEPSERAEIVGLMFAELDLITAPAPLPAEKDSRYCFFHGEYTPDLWDCPTCPAD